MYLYHKFIKYKNVSKMCKKNEKVKIKKCNRNILNQ